MSVGFAQQLTGLSAGSNYVMRVPISYDRSRRSQPRVYARDVTNGAYITWLDGPKLVGAHDGADNLATLINSEGKFTQSLIGGKIYNITDGSSGTITAVSVNGTIITGALSGGTEDDWDASDEYMLVPPNEDNWVWCEPFCFELPTIARNGVAADCVACEWGVVNLSDGDLVVHQYETQANIIDNPSLETGAGDPWLPDGWVNLSLDAGDSQAEAAILHSGAGSLRLNAGATSGEGIYRSYLIATGKFYSCGGWVYGSGVSSPQLFAHNKLKLLPQFQADGGVGYPLSAVAAVWAHLACIYRALDASSTGLGFIKGDAVIGYADDNYAFLLDDVSLTVTPASEANSAESTGLRVDGRDACTQPIPAGKLKATKGRIRWKWTPRHDAANLESFSEEGYTYLVDAFRSSQNRLLVQSYGLNQVRLFSNIAAVSGVALWDSTGAVVAGTTYSMEVRYSSTKVELLVDEVVKATVTRAVDFGALIPTMAYWGHRYSKDHQVDATFAAP